MSRRVDQAHRARQVQLRERVGGQLGALLVALPSLEQQHVDAYVQAAYPIVAAGQRVAAQTSAAYAGLLVERRTRKPRAVNVDQALVSSGVLVNPDTPWLVSPALRAMGLTNDGMSLGDALTAAASYAYALSSTDLQTASAVGIDEGARAGGSRVTGYSKVIASGSCQWCADQEGETFETASDVPFHERDQCGVAPILEGA